MTLLKGDCIELMWEMPDNSIDAIVTDPPYELGFMGKGWDASGIAYSVELWAEALRVLKPGGHLLAFGGTRTYHRMTVAIEDAGFEIRDSIHWIYGSGFPKSLNVGKALEAQAKTGSSSPKAQREAAMGDDYEPTPLAGTPGYGTTGNFTNKDTGSKPLEVTDPAAQQWQGWGTALKPAHEPIVVARKPLIGTVAANVLEHGTGALNIDGCRIAGAKGDGNWKGQTHRRGYEGGWDGTTKPNTEQNFAGRWPANVIFDEDAAAELDAQSGITTSRTDRNPIKRNDSKSWFTGDEVNRVQRGDTGGASRFFYCAKASKAERNAGLEALKGSEIGAKGNGLARACASCGASVLNGCDCPDRTFVNPTRANFHPTVKPIALMRWLVRLATPPGGIVLDPFLGSGTTAVAATLEGFRWLGCELTEDYWPIIEARIKWAENQTVETSLF